jgi:hypothetical protein
MEPTSFNEGAPEIQRDEIQFDLGDKKSLLGEGSFGSVYKVCPDPKARCSFFEPGFFCLAFVGPRRQRRRALLFGR